VSRIKEMRLCLFIIRFLAKVEKIIVFWKPKKPITIEDEDTFFLYDLDTQESEALYP
jgi:hypothetical protein